MHDAVVQVQVVASDAEVKQLHLAVSVKHDFEVAILDKRVSVKHQVLGRLNGSKGGRAVRRMPQTDNGPRVKQADWQAGRQAGRLGDAIADTNRHQCLQDYMQACPHYELIRRM